LYSAIVHNKSKSSVKLEPKIQVFIEGIVIFISNDLGNFEELLKESVLFLKKQENIKTYQTTFDLCKHLDFFPEYSIKKNKKVLIVSPHIDDAVLSCSGVLFDKLKKGYDVGVLDVFCGEPKVLSSFAEDFMKKKNVDCDPKKRIEEEENVSKKLGFKAFYLPNLDGVFVVDSEKELFGGKFYLFFI